MPLALPASSLAFGFVLLAGLTSGCGVSRIPDPQIAAKRFAEAARAGDSSRIYGLLSREAQRDFGREGTRLRVTESRRELAQWGAALVAPPIRVEGLAEVRFDDGESALLSLEGGAFRVSSLGTLPSGAQNPADALGDFRRALARRSYPALLGVLSAETRAALEGELRSLVEGLENPRSLVVKISGDNAVVLVPGGHRLQLKREAGVWKIQDFD